MNIVIAILQQGDAFAFLQKTDGTWIFPGGPIQSGETVTQSVLREVEEVTGVKADMIGLLGTREMDGDTYIYAYCAHNSGILRVMDAHKFVHADWKTPQEIINIAGTTLYGPVRAILEAARSATRKRGGDTNVAKQAGH
jgi:ADP-ribose pyrophosphatase YjhB (NUDIX family)